MSQVANLITPTHINTNGQWSAAVGASTSIHSSASSTEYVYTLANPNWTFDANAHTFKYCNDPTSSDYQKWMDLGSANPWYVVEGLTHNTTTSTGANPQIVSFWQNTSLLFAINNPYYTSSTSTEGVATVQWSASFSKNPGDDYWRWTVTGLNTDSTDYIYLYDEMPTSTSTHQPIGTRTFTSSSSSSTQYGLFIPDITKTYYVINFLSGGSFEILATKNFAAKKKVFCNFW
jgi:hypothetical protein